MPPEPVAGISHMLEAMSSLPAYRDARQWLLRNLGISHGSSVIEASCGTAAALPEVWDVVGSNGRITGNDPTKAFVDSADTGREAWRTQCTIRDWRHTFPPDCRWRF